MSLVPFDKKIWLATPKMHEEELKYIEEAFNKNWVSTVGENIDAFEEGVCNYIGCKHAVALSSGTAAIHMALKTAGIKQGDKVFCSDLTFAATVNPIIYEKAVPVFIDSEPDTWNMDPNALENAFKLYPDTKAVVVVHLYGTPAQIDKIKNICDKYGAVLIEDAAESLGATYRGKQTGTFGEYSAISFNGNKIITTSGGGMFLTNSSDAANHVRKLSTQAREQAPWYQHNELGFNYRMSNIVAGIGRGQITHLEEHINMKKQIHDRYKEGFRGLPIKMNPFIAENMLPNYWLSCMIIDKKAMCTQQKSETEAKYIKEVGKTCPTEILETLSRYNVEGRPIWKPMHLQPIFRKYEFISRDNNEVVSEDIFDRGLCLPSDINMLEDEQGTIIEIVTRCFK